MNTKKEQLLELQRTLKDGRVEAVHIWATGWQELIFANMESFNRAKARIEAEVPSELTNGND